MSIHLQTCSHFRFLKQMQQVNWLMQFCCGLPHSMDKKLSQTHIAEDQIIANNLKYIYFDWPVHFFNIFLGWTLS